MKKKIGGEFWEADLCVNEKLTVTQDYNLLLSGRTALDYIIKDMKLNKVFETVKVPTYCCHTMIKPFIDNGVAVDFYNVNFENGSYNYDINCVDKFEAILIMQYFGFYNEFVNQAVKDLQKRGIIVIEDATHSWFSNPQYNSSSDYVFASFRKWTGLPCGAIAIKQNNDFNVNLSDKINENYIYLREKAANYKKRYIDKGNGCEKVYLELFTKAEDVLDDDYRGYVLPDLYKSKSLHMDYNKIKSARKNNADFLISELKTFKELETINKRTAGDTPLFVPIYVNNKLRNKLQKYLKDNDVYCPIHWPLTDFHKIEDMHLYQDGLSIVCDQRYCRADMERIIKIFKFFFNEVTSN